MHQSPKLWVALFVGTLVSSSLGCAEKTKAAGTNTVEAILQVSFSKLDILPSKTTHSTLEAFEVFRDTQAVLLKSQFVLRGALVRREIASLKVVRSHEPDPVHWLRKSLEVSVPKNSTLIVLRLTDSGDTKQLRKILDAVIRAHEQEVITPRRASEFENHEELKKYYQNSLKEYETNLERYYLLSGELKADDKTVNSTRLDMLKFELDTQHDFLKELAREIRIIDLNMKLSNSRVRFVMLATVVEE